MKMSSELIPASGTTSLLGGILRTWVPWKLAQFVTVFILCAPGGALNCQGAAVSLYVYDLSTGRQLHALPGHYRPTTAVAISPDSALALTGSMTPELKLWSLKEGRELRSIIASTPGNGGPASSLAFVHGTNVVLVGRESSQLQLWDIQSNVLVRQFAAPFQGISSALFSKSSSGESLFGLSPQSVSVAVWNPSRRDPTVVFSEEWAGGTRWVTLARDRKVRAWYEAETGEAWPESRPAPPTGNPGWIDKGFLSPDGRKLVTCGVSITRNLALWLRLWDLETGKLLWHSPAVSLPWVSNELNGAGVAFSSDSRLFAVAQITGEVDIYETQEGKREQTLKAAAESCSRIAFHPNGQILVTWGNGTLRTWSLSTRQSVRSFSVPIASCMAISPDGRLLLVGGYGKWRGN